MCGYLDQDVTLQRDAVHERSPESEALSAADLSLVQRALSGDSLAIQTLVDRLGCVPAILRVRNARTGSPLRPDQLDDAQQEVLISVWRKLGEYAGRSRFETWVHGFCTHEILRARQNLARRVRVDSLSAPNELIATPETVADDSVHQGLDRLGPPADDILRMKHFDECTFEEIAERFDVSVSTIKSRYYRGLTKLGTILQGHHPETDA